jgi:hypothetical protein
VTTLYRAGAPGTPPTSWTSSRAHAEQYRTGKVGPFGGEDIFETTVAAGATVLDLRPNAVATLRTLGIDVEDYDYFRAEMLHDFVRDLMPMFVANGYQWIVFYDANNPEDEWLELPR